MRDKALYDFYPSGLGLANKQLEMFADYFDVSLDYLLGRSNVEKIK